MKRAAIGIRAHSGWAAVVAVAGHLSTPAILDRQRIAVVDSGAPRAGQPYHFAKNLPLQQADAHLAECAKTARLFAIDGLKAMADRLRHAQYEIAYCGVLMASGRPVPALPEILASHAMIHTAEGEFFRNVFSDACQQLGIPVTKVHERELFDRAAKELRLTSAKIVRRLTALGRELGPPWTQDQKSAALVGWLLLNGGTKGRTRATRGRSQAPVRR